MATEKRNIVAYDGTKITFYPNSHRYQKEGEKTYLLSPSSITGVLDKSVGMVWWVKDEATKHINKIVSDTDTYSKPAILQMFDEAIQIHKSVLETAQDLGSMIHAFAEDYAYKQVMGEKLPTQDDLLYEEDGQVKAAKQAFLEFVKANKVEFINVEMFVYSKHSGTEFVGMFDGIVKINGKRMLIDWKSSKSVYTSQKYQLAGYDIALQEQLAYLYANGMQKEAEALEYESIAVIHIDKNTGTPTLHELSNEERSECRMAFNALAVVKTIEKKLSKYGSDN